MYHTNERAAKPKVDSVGTPSALLHGLAIPVDTRETIAHALLNTLRRHSQASQVASRLTGEVVASEPEHPQSLKPLKLARDRT